MPSKKNNEVAPEISTPQTNSQEPDVKSVAPTKDNYTTDKKNNQPTNESNVIDITTSCFRFKKKLDAYAVAEYMVTNCYVITIKGLVYIYSNGVYERRTEVIDRIICKLAKGATKSELKNVYENLAAIAPEMEPSSYYYVAFNNCIVDVRTLEIIHYEDVKPLDYIITSKVYADYDLSLINTENSHLDFVKSFFDVISCNDRGVKQLLFEIIGYSMIRSAKFQLGFILKGYSNNGKSDYLHIIENLLGNFCSHQTLSQLAKPKFLMALYGCTGNIVDDTCEIKKLDFAQIQSIISGGTLALDDMAKKEFSFAPYSTLILATNHYLCFRGCQREILRRFVVVPFSANLDDCADVDMTENICSQENLNIIATLSTKFFSKVLTDKRFHLPEIVENSTNTFFIQANPVLEFLKTHPINRLVSKSDYFMDFYRWCMKNGIDTSETNATFGTQVIAYGYEPKPHVIEGKKDTYYQKLGYNLQSLKEEYSAYVNSLENSSEVKTLCQYILFLYEQDEGDFAMS